MRTWLMWVGWFFVLILAALVHPHHTELDTMGVFIALGTLAWVGAGALLAARATLRFLRR